MTDRIVGIDPGQKGGVACLDGDRIVGVDPMPILDKKVMVRDLSDLLSLYDPGLVIIEQQTIMGMQKGAMAIGSNFGRLLAVVEMQALPHLVVTPTVWNRRAQIPPNLKGKAKKEASYAAARRTWGQAFDDLGLRVTQDGLYEALLIARYGTI